MMKQLYAVLLDFLYPPRCVFCDGLLQPGTVWKVCPACQEKAPEQTGHSCPNCYSSLHQQHIPHCGHCSIADPKFDGIMHLWRYADDIRQSIHRFKYGNRPEYAQTLGYYMAHHLKELTLIKAIDAIVPTPLHAKRYAVRGYNQAGLLAETIGKETGITVLQNALVRLKNTQPQMALTKIQRLENMKDCMGVNGKAIKNVKHILLIDDIFTTGATLSACAQALKDAGVKKVYCLCVAYAALDEM